MAFLQSSDGGEGFVSEDEYLMLWRCSELAFLNAAYQVRDYVPGLLLIGSDGSGDAFGFDTRDSHWPVVRVPFVGWSCDVAEAVGRDFVDFIARLCQADGGG